MRWTCKCRASNCTPQAGRKPLTFRRLDGKLEINFDPPIAAGEAAVYSVAYRVVKPRHGLFFVKPTAAHPEKVAHAWTQSQDEYARYWFPCLDYPLREAAHHDDDRRFRREPSRSATASWSSVKTMATQRLSLPPGRSAQHLPDDDGRRARSSRSSRASPGARRAGVRTTFCRAAKPTAHRSFGKTPQMIETFEQRHRQRRIRTRATRRSPLPTSSSAAWRIPSATTQTDRTLHDETRASRFLRAIRSFRTSSRTSGSAICSPAAIGRTPGSTKASPRTSKRSGGKPISATTSTCTTSSSASDALFRRRRRALPPPDRLQYLSRSDRDLRPPPLSKRAARCCTCCAASSATRGSGARSRDVRATQRAAQRRDDRFAFARSKRRPAATARASSINGCSARAIRSSRSRVAWDAQRKIATRYHRSKAAGRRGQSRVRFDVRWRLRRHRGEERRPLRARTSNAPTRASRCRSTSSRCWCASIRDPSYWPMSDISLGADFSAAVLERRSRHRGAHPRRAGTCRGRQRRLPIAQLRRRSSATSFGASPREAASAAGATRAPWARDLLIAALAHEHPKVRARGGRSAGQLPRCRDGRRAVRRRRRSTTRTSYAPRR